MTGYVFQPFNGMTPGQTIDARKRAQMLAKQGTDISPVGHWTQAIARGLQGLSGAAWSDQAGDAERQGQDAVGKVYKALMDGQATPQQASAALMQTGGWGAQQGQQMANAVVKQRMAQSDPMNALKQRQIELQMKLAEDQASRQNRLFDMDLETRKAQAAGNLALIIQNEKDPALRAQRWQQLAPTLPPQYQSMPLEAAIPALISRAGMAKDYISMNRPGELKVNTLAEGGSIAVTDPRTGRTVITAQNDRGNKADAKFGEAAATSQVSRYDEAVKQGTSQKAALATIRTLRTLSDKIGAPGVGNTIARTLGPTMRNFGIEATNLSDMEAFNAIISRLVPSQRPPGSGTMSDKDVDLFKQSLPQLAATAGGRKLILDQMEAIAQYDIQRAQITSRALNGEIPRQTAEQMLRNMPDPMELFRQATARQKRGGTPGATGDTAVGGGPRYVNPQTGEVITWNGREYVNAQGIPISDAQGRPYPPASR